MPSIKMAMGKWVVQLAPNEYLARNGRVHLFSSAKKAKAAMAALNTPTERIGECADCDAPAPVGLYQCEPCHKRARESAGV